VAITTKKRKEKGIMAASKFTSRVNL